MLRWPQLPRSATSFLVGVLLLAGLGAVAAAEEPASLGDPALEAMRALSGLVGRWQGEGWVRQGPGEPRAFRGEEVVESRLDGRVLIIEGRHLAAAGDKVVHHALAILSYDPKAGTYRFRSHLASGQSGEFEGSFEGGAFVWGFPNERGQVRYTIRLEADRWNEVGDFSADGQSWSRFFEMNLTRAGS